MHSLLARQLRRLLPGIDPEVGEIAPFIAAVDAAYDQADVERSMIERSMELSSGELMDANRQLQATLHRAQVSEEQYRALIETSRNAVLLLDAERHVHFANGGFQTIFQRDPATILGQPIDRALGLTDRDEVARLEEALTGGEFRGLALLLPNGADEQSLEVSALPIVVGSDRRLFVDIRDVTEERAARRREEQIRVLTSERRNSEALAESISGGLLLTDADGRVTYCNGRYENVVGESRASVIGAPLSEVMTRIATRTEAPTKAATALQTASDQAAASPSVTVDLVEPVARSLRIAWFAIQTDDGEFIGRGHLVTDITRDREIDQMKSEFVALASHELRTPLTSIYGFSDLLRDDDTLSDVQLQRVGFIHAEAERLTTIVERLLNVSRIEAGHLVLADTEVSAADVLEASLRAAVPVDQHHRVVPPPAPPTTIRGDRDAIVQVIANLIDNALKYSGDDPVHIACTEVGTNEVAFIVGDSGPGIAGNELPRLFDRFHRVARPEFDHIRSTGLGLYVVKEYVERMGGRVTVDSIEGHGSTFTVFLPTFVEAAEEAA